MATKQQSKISKLRVPPQSLEAEQALLGSMLIKPDSLFEIMEYVRPEVFYATKHQIIMAAMIDLMSKNEPIDILTLSTYLKDRDQLESVGGDTYITELATSVPSASNVEHYAKLVFEKYIKRRLISAAEQISEIGFDSEYEVEQALEKAEKEVFEISQNMATSDFAWIADELKEAYERLERLQEGEGKLRGIPTGFASLDNKLSGFQRSDMIILAARPSVGKTSFALDVARKVAVDHGQSVAFFSLEMGKSQLIDRMLAAEARVDAWRMRTGNLKAETDFESLRDAIGRLSEAKIYIDDNSYNNILRMKSAARKLKRKNGLDLIVVDYLQLMAPMTKSNSVVQEVTEISRGLKQLAKELDVPVIALSQLSRNIEHRGDNSEPRLADLRDSGSIEQDADVVLFLHRPKEEDGGAAQDKQARGSYTKLIIEKHRNGSTGAIELHFDHEKTSFQEIDGAHSFSDFDQFDEVSEQADEF